MIIPLTSCSNSSTYLFVLRNSDGSSGRGAVPTQRAASIVRMAAARRPAGECDAVGGPSRYRTTTAFSTRVWLPWMSRTA
jgi:hypothetical protein